MGSTSITLLRRLHDMSDGEAWGEFMDRYQSRVLAWCRSKGLQEADALDLTQTVLAKVARAMETFTPEPGGNFSGWLHTVWVNAWKDSLKAPLGGRGTGDSAVLEQLSEVEGEDFTKELEAAIEAVFQRQRLEQALARVRPSVSPRDWEIFHDIVFGDKSASEVAKERKMTLAAVGMVKLRVQRRLAEEVARPEGTGRK